MSRRLGMLCWLPLASGCSLVVSDDPSMPETESGFYQSFDNLDEVECVVPGNCFREGPPREMGTGLCSFVDAPGVLRVDDNLDLRNLALRVSFAFNVLPADNGEGARAIFLSLRASLPIELTFITSTTNESMMTLRAQIPAIGDESSVMQVGTFAVDAWHTFDLNLIPNSENEGVLRISAAGRSAERLVQTSELSSIELGCIDLPISGFASPLAFDEFRYDVEASDGT